MKRCDGGLQDPAPPFLVDRDGMRRIEKTVSRIREEW